jgi:hypothetical protein
MTRYSAPILSLMGVVDVGDPLVLVEVVHADALLVDDVLHDLGVGIVHLAVVVGVGEGVQGLPVDVLGGVGVGVGAYYPVDDADVGLVYDVVAVGVARLVLHERLEVAPRSSTLIEGSGAGWNVEYAFAIRILRIIRIRIDWGPVKDPWNN